MRNGGGLWIISLVAALVQTSYLAAWRPFGVVPDLTLLVIVLIALTAGLVPTLIAAVAGGLVLDFAAGANFGLNTLVLMIVAGGFVYLRSLGLAFGFWLSILSVGAASLLFGLLQGAAILLSHGSMGGFGGRLAMTLIIDLILAVILTRPLANLFRPLSSSAQEMSR